MNANNTPSTRKRGKPRSTTRKPKPRPADALIFIRVQAF